MIDLVYALIWYNLFVIVPKKGRVSYCPDDTFFLAK